MGDAIENYHEGLEKAKSKDGYAEVITEPPYNHKTLVIVNISAASSELYIERASRFVYSLNTGQTIKADIVSVSDGTMYEGFIITGSKSGGMIPPPSPHIQRIEVNG